MSFANELRIARAEESTRDAAALEAELRKNGVPAPRDLASLRALKVRYLVPADVFDVIVGSVRAGKKFHRPR
jgi:hypothetical protein